MQRDWHYRQMSSGVGGSVQVGTCPECEAMVFAANDGPLRHEQWHRRLDEQIAAAAHAQAVPPPEPVV